LPNPEFEVEVENFAGSGEFRGFDAAETTIALSLERIAEIPSAEHLARRISQNPDIARWVAELAQRHATVELEEAQRIPNVTANGEVRRHNETRDTALVMLLSIPLPIFDRNQGTILEARYQLAKAGEERRTAEVRVLTDLAATYAELSSAFIEATTLRNEILAGAQSAFEAFSEGYRQGKFGFLDVLDA